MPSRGEPSPIRVCTIPGRHRYVDRCLEGAEDVQHLPDPTGSTSYADPWQPSPALRPDWIAEHAGDIDVVHLHFGFEHRTPGQLRKWVEALALHHIALVLTVHDLDNPHVAEQETHHRSLGLLINAAAETLTLTQGAAEFIQRRYGVTAQVVAHPHQFDLGLVGRRIRPRSGRGGLIGLNLRSMRKNVDAPAALALLEHAPASSQVVVRVSQSTLAGNDRVGAMVAQGAQDGRWEVDAVDGYTGDHELWEFLSGIDALLLPYRWGTHSGWVESCWDVGTTVIAPPVGHYAQQHPVTELSLDSAPETVRRVLGDLRPNGGASAQARHAERVEVAASHALTYHRVLQ
ncbi:MAG: hypothetical protein ABI360_09670 [Allobranchiibius sp.]